MQRDMCTPERAIGAGGDVVWIEGGGSLDQIKSEGKKLFRVQ